MGRDKPPGDQQRAAMQAVGAWTLELLNDPRLKDEGCLVSSQNAAINKNQLFLGQTPRHWGTPHGTRPSKYEEVLG